jgi:Ni,Fe-hydrogenase III component G
MLTDTKTIISYALQKRLQNPYLRIDEIREDMIITSATIQDFVPAVSFIHDRLGGRFITSVGADTRTLTGMYQVTQLFALDEDKVFLVLNVEINPAQASIPSVVDIIPGVAWAEREVFDMIGVEPLGHPDPRRLVLPDDWPENVHPLRKDFKVDERPPAAPGNKVRINIPPKDASVLPIGPFFPTLEEPVFINLFVHGEEIVGMDYRGFYGHRGVEKLADAELTYQQVPYIAERICGI